LEGLLDGVISLLLSLKILALLQHIQLRFHSFTEATGLQCRLSRPAQLEPRFTLSPDSAELQH
jgi:hypothetical protein